VGEFVVRVTADKKLLTPSLEDKLNPLTINIVAAEVLQSSSSSLLLSSLELSDTQSL